MENFSLISCYPNSKDQLDKILLGLFKILRKINIYNEDQKMYSDRINYNMISFRDYKKRTTNKNQTLGKYELS